MRLIDADEVKKYIHDLMLNNADRYTDKEMAQYDNLIDSCQTVEAITIDWINKYIDHMINIFGPMDILTMLRKYKQGFIPSVPEKEPIENWEEANETN